MTSPNVFGLITLVGLFGSTAMSPGPLWPIIGEVGRDAAGWVCVASTLDVCASVGLPNRGVIGGTGLSPRSRTPDMLLFVDVFVDADVFL